MKRFLITFFSLLTVSLVFGQVVQSIGIKSGLSIANQIEYYNEAVRYLENAENTLFSK